ncbi:MAG TPA: isochorismatase family cysteine hydrolase [Solirubrobacterales bacterium]|nr:isochorismatase family cysteine hydrolase [Solirubrobacterales bacterium]
MQVANGPTILTTLEEKVDPAHTAVVVIDMQRDFTARGMFGDKLGLDISPMEALAERLRGFLADARAAEVPVIHVMSRYDPTYMSEPMHERLHRLGLPRYCLSGTEGIEFHEGLEPEAGETVVVKHRFDAFHGTDLHVVLAALGIKTVILAGVAVHACVDSTARHAYFLDYYVVFGSDLTGGAPTAAVHEMTLDSINSFFGVTATAEEIAATWRGRVAAAAGAASEGGEA